MSIEDNAYDNGYASYVSRESTGIDANPYPRGSADWYEWREGWLDADEHAHLMRSS